MQRDSIRLFRFAGIEVYLHFSWFLIAFYQFTMRPHGYSSPVFALYEYVALFVIVLLHEFGHAFATRQVGGIANYILLWPFGGIAFVRAPERPGAQLWSIVAGPLVNVILIPVFFVLGAVAVSTGLPARAPDTYRLFFMIAQINIVILIFNLLPVYPLDGGQILRSLLWYPLGRIRSLQVASVIGLVGGAAFVLYAWRERSLLLGIMALFLLSQAFAGWQHSRALRAAEAEAETAPRPPVL